MYFVQNIISFSVWNMSFCCWNSRNVFTPKMVMTKEVICDAFKININIKTCVNHTFLFCVVKSYDNDLVLYIHLFSKCFLNHVYLQEKISKNAKDIQHSFFIGPFWIDSLIILSSLSSWSYQHLTTRLLFFLRQNTSEIYWKLSSSSHMTMSEIHK